MFNFSYLIDLTTAINFQQRSHTLRQSIKTKKKKKELFRQGQVIKRQILEAQYELDQADLQVHFLEAEEDPVSKKPIVSRDFFQVIPKDVEEEDEWRPRPFVLKIIILNPYVEELTLHGALPVNSARDNLHWIPWV